MPEEGLLHLPERAGPVSEAWTDADIARFLARLARLTRDGRTESDAERLAEQAVNRRRDGDDRVKCSDCRHYRPGRCVNHRRAGLRSAAVCGDFAERPQRCSGFRALP